MKVMQVDSNNYNPQFGKVILKEGGDINKMIATALEHSDHKLRTRGLLNVLTSGKYFMKEKDFDELMPVYDVSSDEIQEYIKTKLLEDKQ